MILLLELCELIFCMKIILVIFGDNRQIFKCFLIITNLCWSLKFKQGLYTSFVVIILICYDGKSYRSTSQSEKINVAKDENLFYEGIYIILLF